MTEKLIIQKLSAWIDTREYPYQVSNAFIYGWESDYWALSSAGMAKEFEIKISRSDYFADAKKLKHQSDAGANYFYYVCPKGLINKQEVDKRYGLIYIWDSGHVSVEKPPRKLHDNRFDQWQMLANKMYFRWRMLWKQKYVDDEIAWDEYKAGFALELNQEEMIGNV